MNALSAGMIDDLVFRKTVLLSPENSPFVLILRTTRTNMIKPATVFNDHIYVYFFLYI